MRACMLPRASAAIALLLLSGCATFQRDKSRPLDKVAVVKAGPWGKVYRGGYVELASVNGAATIAPEGRYVRSLRVSAERFTVSRQRPR